MNTFNKVVCSSSRSVKIPSIGDTQEDQIKEYIQSQKQEFPENEKREGAYDGLIKQ